MADDLFFGAWLPDAPDYKNPGCLIAENVIPTPGGYSPQPRLLSAGKTISAAAKGAALMFTSDGVDVIVGGMSTKLFVDRDGTITETSGYTTVGAEESWDFCQFNDFVIATSINNNPQYLSDIDTDTTWSTLDSTAPKARYCARVEDFVMLGNIDGHTNRIQWSSVNSPTRSWTPDRLYQSGYADLPRHLGAVQRIVGGRYPLVMQERGVSRLTYIGPPAVWRAEEIELARGVLAPFSVVSVGFVTYYLGQDGFWSTDGNSFVPVGSQKVNKWFFENVASDSIALTHGAVDFENSCVVWAFKSVGSSFDKLIRYSWVEDRWSYTKSTVTSLVESVPGGYTLEQLGALYPVLEDVPASLDAGRWKGRNRALSAFVDDTLYTFTGDPLTARIITGEFQPVPGRRCLVKRGRVLGNGGQNWQIATIPAQNDASAQQAAWKSPGVDGKAPLRGEGMTMRIAARSHGDWEAIQGVQLDVRVTGGR